MAKKRIVDAGNTKRKIDGGMVVKTLGAEPFNPHEFKEHKFAETVVNGDVCEIWERNETHYFGKVNGYSDNRWVKVGNNWYPWVDSFGYFRPCWDINIEQGHRERGDKDDVRGFVRVDILCNKKKVYEFYTSDLHYAFAKAQVTVTLLGDIPICIWDLKKEIGRKIYYRDYYPCVITWIGDHGVVGIKRADGKPFPLTGWEIEYKENQEKNGMCCDDGDEMEIIEDLLSNKIFWFRDKLIKGETK